ncbi:hypothetical protein B0I08_10585 [Glaciihabitans tibetensis]|uniref:Uncharacterized protein n=1 Tax=Glaciihabitans tibetensis TaxID=1266600 RepID=A0A2T0VCR8_9MICO|nr:hypothetical protein [Glaciihabitans tibetensis]PRY67924.1 hypothetical protein B0I08_10585 [Glaciihabitans tibetensis]
MPLAPSPLNPDHGLRTRPSLAEVSDVQRWISRRYGLPLAAAAVDAIVANQREGSAVRHRLRWAFTHDRWALKLSRHGRTEAQSLECVPVNGARVYEWARHVNGQRTPAPVYPGEAWNVDASFSHLITSGPTAGIHWDASVEDGFADWATARYGLRRQEVARLRLTDRRHHGTPHRSIAQIITCEVSPSAQHLHELSLLWLNSKNVIVDKDGDELTVIFTPGCPAAPVVTARGDVPASARSAGSDAALHGS